MIETHLKPTVTGAARRPYLSKYVIFQLRQAIRVIEESTMPPLKPNLPASSGAAYLRRLCDWHDSRKEQP